MFNSSGVDEIAVVLTAANTGSVPETFGKDIVLSLSVGSIIDKVVSCASAVAPSNTSAFCALIVWVLTVVVVPDTVRLPVTVRLSPTVTSDVACPIVVAKPLVCAPILRVAPSRKVC